MIEIPRTANFEITSARASAGGQDHVIILSKQLPAIPLLRIHSECLTGDVLGSLRCDCGDQLRMALAAIASQGGLILYMRQEGRGIGLTAKLKTYELQDVGYDTVDANLRLGYPADARTYDDAVRILRSLRIAKVRLMTNNPCKVQGLRDGGIEVVAVLPCLTKPTVHNTSYLQVKKSRMGHCL